MKNKHFSNRLGLSFLAVIGLIIAGLLALTVNAQELTSSYFSESTLIRGSVVALKEEGSQVIEPINGTQLERMFGVVVRSNDTALSLSEKDQTNFVATKGKFEVLVSDVNGEIKNGDLLTLSPFSGIAMKADDRQKLVIGTALQDFDINNADNILSTTDVKDDQGQTFKSAIGRILVDVEVKPNPLFRANQAVPTFLSELSSNIAQKPVSATRIYAGMVVLFISSAVAASLMYSVVRSAVISIGRNPLSKKSIMKGIIQVIFVSIIIFVAGLFAVYLILKL